MWRAEPRRILRRIPEVAMHSWVPCLARSSALALLALTLRASDVLGAAPPPPTIAEPSLLLRPARVFDATSEEAHEGWVRACSRKSVGSLPHAKTRLGCASAKAWYLSWCAWASRP